MSTQIRTQTIERTLRPWGWFETVSEEPGNKIKRIGVLPGQQISMQKHHRRAEHWVVATTWAKTTSCACKTITAAARKPVAPLARYIRRGYIHTPPFLHTP